MSESTPFPPLGPYEIPVDVDRSRYRNAQRETDLQYGFRDWLTENQPHLTFGREVVLGSRRRPDFVAVHRIAGVFFVTVFELKIIADRAAVRQLEGYVEEVEQETGGIVSGVLAAEQFYLGTDPVPAWMALVKLTPRYFHGSSSCQH